MMRISGAHTSFLSFRLFSLAAASTAGRICSMIQSLRSTQRWIEAIVSRKNRPKQGKVWAAKDRMRPASVPAGKRKYRLTSSPGQLLVGSGAEICSGTISHWPRRRTQIALWRQTILLVSRLFKVNDNRKVNVIQATSPRRVILRSLLGVSLPAEILSKKIFWTPFWYSRHPRYLSGITSKKTKSASLASNDAGASVLRLFHAA